MSLDMNQLVKNVQFAAGCAQKASENGAAVMLVVIIRPDGAIGLMPHPTITPEELEQLLHDAHRASKNQLGAAILEGRDRKTFEQLHKEAGNN